MTRKANSEQVVTLLVAKELFLPLHKLKLGVGNSSRTMCDVFTAGGNLVIKTNTGDYKGRAEGELWPSVSLSMLRLKQLARIYCKSDAPVRIERIGQQLKVDTTLFELKAGK